MTFDAKAVLLEKLELIKAGPKDPVFGICGMLDQHIWQTGTKFNFAQAKEVDKNLQALFEKWPEYSGDMHYPVPSTNKKHDMRNAFYACGNMWGNTPYGSKRRELLDWMINELKGQNQ